MQNDPMDIRIRYLMLSRVAVVTFLLGIATFVEIKGQEFLPEISLMAFYITVIVSYVLSIIYYFMLGFTNNLRINLFIQTFGDVVLVTWLVFSTGGIRSIYTVFYMIVIIYAVIFMGRRVGLITASACTIFYGGLLDLEYYNILLPLYATLQEASLGAGYFLSRIIVNSFSFYLIAILASFVVEQEKKTRTLLEEKASAFNQLDLLHRSIIESVETGIMTVNLQGKIKSFNRAAEEITGYAFSDIEDSNILDVFPEYRELQEKVTNVKETDSNKSRVELAVKGRTNKSLILGCSISALKDSEGTRIGDILVFQDLTAIKKMEQNLEKNRRLAFVGEMAAGLAHEVRNPLASISGSIQILRQGLQLDATDERLMQIILRGKDQLESFMKDFLLLSRPTPGVHEAVNVNEIIEEILESIQYVPDWREQIIVRRSLSNHVPIIASKTEVRQLIWNLVINAVQAMPEGGSLYIATSPAVSSGVSGRDLEIKIVDSGCGIDEAELGKVFEPFYTTKEKGTGLGLAIVHRIVEGHAGKIKIDSEPSRGTTVSVWLPALSDIKE